MNLFFNAVSKNAYICLFDEKRNIIDEQNFSVYQNESSILPKLIDNFIKKNKLFYKDIENIVVVE
jgi:tRNA A37 threonylcarbamoyladenosine modification protein TsaB